MCSFNNCFYRLVWLIFTDFNYKLFCFQSDKNCVNSLILLIINIENHVPVKWIFKWIPCSSHLPVKLLYRWKKFDVGKSLCKVESNWLEHMIMSLKYWSSFLSKIWLRLPNINVLNKEKLKKLGDFTHGNTHVSTVMIEPSCVPFRWSNPIIYFRCPSNQ